MSVQGKPLITLLYEEDFREQKSNDSPEVARRRIKNDLGEERAIELGSYIEANDYGAFLSLWNKGSVNTLYSFFKGRNKSTSLLQCAINNPNLDFSNTLLMSGQYEFSLYDIHHDVIENYLFKLIQRYEKNTARVIRVLFANVKNMGKTEEVRRIDDQQIFHRTHGYEGEGNIVEAAIELCKAIYRAVQMETFNPKSLKVLVTQLDSLHIEIISYAVDKEQYVQWEHCLKMVMYLNKILSFCKKSLEDFQAKNQASLSKPHVDRRSSSAKGLSMEEMLVRSSKSLKHLSYWLYAKKVVTDKIGNAIIQINLQEFTDNLEIACHKVGSITVSLNNSASLSVLGFYMLETKKNRKKVDAITARKIIMQYLRKEETRLTCTDWEFLSSSRSAWLVHEQYTLLKIVNSIANKVRDENLDHSIRINQTKATLINVNNMNTSLEGTINWIAIDKAIDKGLFVFRLLEADVEFSNEEVLNEMPLLLAPVLNKDDRQLNLNEKKNSIDLLFKKISEVCCESKEEGSIHIDSTLHILSAAKQFLQLSLEGELIKHLLHKMYAAIKNIVFKIVTKLQRMLSNEEIATIKGNISDVKTFCSVSNHYHGALSKGTERIEQLELWYRLKQDSDYQSKLIARDPKMGNVLAEVLLLENSRDKQYVFKLLKQISNAYQHLNAGTLQPIVPQLNSSTPNSFNPSSYQLENQPTSYGNVVRQNQIKKKGRCSIM